MEGLTFNRTCVVCAVCLCDGNRVV